MAVLSPEQIAYVAASPKGGGFAGDDLVEAVAVALAESGGNTDAVSPPNADAWGSRDRGTWQINDHWHADLLRKYTWSNPYASAQMARLIHDEAGGWGPWSTFPGKAAGQLAVARRAVANPQPPPQGADDTGGTVHDPAGVKNENPIAAAVDSVGAQIKRISDVFGAVLWITNPTNVLRVLVGTAGGALVLGSLLLLGYTAFKAEAP